MKIFDLRGRVSKCNPGTPGVSKRESRFHFFAKFSSLMFERMTIHESRLYNIITLAENPLQFANCFICTQISLSHQKVHFSLRAMKLN